MSEPTRTYRSPLRDSQVEQTRTLILDTLVEMLSDGRMRELSVRKLAAAAGVSERTVYRYFPDRASLLDALSNHIGERLGTNAYDHALDSIDDILNAVPEVHHRFDRMAALSKAEVLLNPDPARLTEGRRRRSQRVAAAVERSFPELDDDDIRRLTALTRTLMASQTWLRLRDEFGLAGYESGQLMAWLMTLMFADVRRRGGLPDLERPAD